MRERLAELQQRVGATRRRLEDIVRRLAAARVSLRDGTGAERAPASQEGDGTPLFQDLRTPSGSVVDLELHFEALDTEDPKQDPKRDGR